MKPIAIGPTKAIQLKLLDCPGSIGKTIGVLVGSVSTEKGVSVGFSYLDTISSLAAAKIEEGIKLDQKEVKIRVKIAKQPSDINIKIHNVARRYITSKRTKIDIAGPIFIGIRAEIN